MTSTFLRRQAFCVFCTLCLVSVTPVAFSVDPDAFKNVTELITSEGYPCEDHSVVTEDGFILSVQRIPASNPSAPVVFLLHGFLDASSTWVINHRNHSLGFILADAGFDVWMGNSRGNIYSQRHTHLFPNQSEFWAWSYDEMAKYDLPAMINFILQTTGAEQLTHIGHSQGNLQAFAAFSTNPTLSDKINLFVALAPVTFFSHQKSLFVDIFARVPYIDLQEVLGSMGFPPDDNTVHEIQKFIPELCSLEEWVCEGVIFMVVGCNTGGQCDPGNLNMTRIPVYASHLGGASVQDLEHLLQASLSATVPYFNYGTQGNKVHYNSSTPPNYDMSQVNVPVCLFVGGKDSFGDPEDVAILEKALPKKPWVHTEPSYTHLDPIWGLNANVRIYPLIVELVSNHSLPALVRD